MHDIIHFTYELRNHCTKFFFHLKHKSAHHTLCFQKCSSLKKYFHFGTCILALCVTTWQHYSRVEDSLLYNNWHSCHISILQCSLCIVLYMCIAYVEKYFQSDTDYGSFVLKCHIDNCLFNWPVHWYESCVQKYLWTFHWLLLWNKTMMRTPRKLSHPQRRIVEKWKKQKVQRYEKRYLNLNQK